MYHRNKECYTYVSQTCLRSLLPKEKGMQCYCKECYTYVIHSNMFAQSVTNRERNAVAAARNVTHVSLVEKFLCNDLLIGKGMRHCSLVCYTVGVTPVQPPMPRFLCHWIYIPSSFPFTFDIFIICQNEKRSRFSRLHPVCPFLFSFKPNLWILSSSNEAFFSWGYKVSYKSLFVASKQSEFGYNELSLANEPSIQPNANDTSFAKFRASQSWIQSSSGFSLFASFRVSLAWRFSSQFNHGRLQFQSHWNNRERIRVSLDEPWRPSPGSACAFKLCTIFPVDWNYYVWTWR